MKRWVDNEARTELYLTYREGALELATRRFAKSTGGVSGFAGQQAGAPHMPGEVDKRL